MFRNFSCCMKYYYHSSDKLNILIISDRVTEDDILATMKGMSIVLKAGKMNQ